MQKKKKKTDKNKWKHGFELGPRNLSGVFHEFLLVGANNSSMPRCPLWQNQSLGGFPVWLLLGVEQSSRQQF
jgi:hypothetical protein